MIQKFTGWYQVHESNRSFADVVAALEAAVGSVENEAFAAKPTLHRAAKNSWHAHAIS